jgi:hypothetical protein
MPLPIGRRDYDVFLSHATSDAAFVRRLRDWLKDCGFQPWLDTDQLVAGSGLATGLQAALDRCRSVLLVATSQALARDWVKNEYNAAMAQRANFADFRIIALRVAGADTSELMQGLTWIDAPEPTLDAATAQSLLHALYPQEKQRNPAGARDVYVSCSWRETDAIGVRKVCTRLAKQGLRLIGDALDQKTSDPARIERLIASCGAFVAIVPFRGDVPAAAREGPYQFFLQEIDIATRLNLPTFVLADPRVRRTDGVSDSAWMRTPLDESLSTSQALTTLDNLWEEWREPPSGAFVFLATDLASSQTKAIVSLVERVTGMTVRIGTDVAGPNIETAIMSEIGKATLVLGDLTDDNVNVCIEIGMALALGRRIEVFARGESRRPPFMLRALQMPTYRDDVELLALVHKLVRPYRRRVINAEL